MKADIHPVYELAIVRCSCGNTFTTRSTRTDLHVELCSECHPFYTGKQKLVDSGGRIEKFERRYGKRKARGVAAESAPALAAERRTALLGVKLTALVRAHTGTAGTPEAFPAGAALALDGAAWILVEDPARSLGRALVWADRMGLTGLNLIVDDPIAAGGLARQAGAFAAVPRVWVAEGRSLVPAAPAPVAPPAEVDGRVLAASPQLRAAGADVVVELGEVAGEVLGLEVARVALVDGEARIEIGVGRHDREAFALLHGDDPAGDRLAGAVATVRLHRSATAPDHPMQRLAAERWLRRLLLDDPEVAGAVSLAPAEPLARRSGVKESQPAAAAGLDAGGAPMLAVCSVGIDPDLVPWAGDLRAARHPGARLVLVVPERDAHAVTSRLAAGLVAPAAVVTVPTDWRRGLHL